MHLYAFGSVCRGEVTPGSDIDLLAITETFDSRFDPAVYSIYSYSRIIDMWKEGTPFAWHLSLESKLLYSDDESDFLRTLGKPDTYKFGLRDCMKFSELFDKARLSLNEGTNSRVFELSNIFLAVRNFATCFSLYSGDAPDFSRNSALRLGPNSLHADPNAYDVLQRARILCTRGIGRKIDDADERIVMSQLGSVKEWMDKLTRMVASNERI